MGTGPMKWLKALGLERREQRAWALYDWAKSAFETTIMAAILPIYFQKVAAADLPDALRTAYWGYTSAVALALVAVISPLLGAIADTLGATKRFLGLFMVMAAGTSSALVLVGQGEWRLAIGLYLVASIGYACSNVFYDALLPAVARPDELDRVSTSGYALGYAGGGLLLLVNLLWVQKPEWFGLADAGVGTRLSFVSVGIWWIVFALPLFKHVKEPPTYRYHGEVGSALRISCNRLIATFREIRRYKQVAIFLLGYWFYSDGIGTIIKMATIYGAEIGIGTPHLIGAMVLVQFLGVPATFAFGALADRISARVALQLSLGVYTGICVLGYFMTDAWHFWALAVLVALVQGGSQALSRSLYATIIPPSKNSEFFAFISVSSRFAGILGPLLFGIVAQLAGGSRLSILFLIAFFVIGMVMLQIVDLAEGRRVAQEADRELQARR